MRILRLVIILLSFINFSCSSEPSESQQPQDKTIYFPPNNSDAWETISPSNLGWNTSEIQPLLDYLEIKNSKSFIILYNGKIAIEAYYGNHNANTPWYWASAGKTLTSTVVGIAADEGLLDINTKVSDFLGTHWTSTSLSKENLITLKNLLSMDSGLDDRLGDNVSPENLQYLADANTRWAYHNVYVKLQDAVAETSHQSWNTYFTTSLKNKIGMSGTWIPMDDLSVYWSTARSMARFGLMISANGKWENHQIVSEQYLKQATNPSQTINEAYGYLWWLNGKSSYHLPQTQIEFQGSLIPNAPTDMYAALGKNDQKIYIVPSKKLVVIRMGEAADSLNFGLSGFDNDLWAKIKAVIN